MMKRDMNGNNESAAGKPEELNEANYYVSDVCPSLLHVDFKLFIAGIIAAKLIGK